MQRRELTADGTLHLVHRSEIRKGLHVLGGIRLALTVDVFNLFNENNVQTVSSD